MPALDTQDRYQPHWWRRNQSSELSSRIHVQPRPPSRRIRSVRPWDPASVWLCSGRVPTHPKIIWCLCGQREGRRNHWGWVCVCVCVAGGEAKGGQKALTLFSFPPFSSFVQSTSPSLQSLLWREGARKPCSVPRVKGWACRGFAAPRLLLGKRGPGASDESATV